MAIESRTPSKGKKEDVTLPEKGLLEKGLDYIQSLKPDSLKSDAEKQREKDKAAGKKDWKDETEAERRARLLREKAGQATDRRDLGTDSN